MGDKAERRARAERIAAAPQDYKVCAGCGSIVRRSAATCPLCAAYRFEEETGRVVEQARHLAENDASTPMGDSLVD